MIDTHVNLHHHLYKDDLSEILERAKIGGIDGMLTICDRIENFETIHKIIEEKPNFWMSVGAHPHEAKDHLDLTPEKLIELSKNDKVIGIGETGLDFFYNLSPKTEQIQVLMAHIIASRETQLPLIIHTRDADELMGEILVSEMKKGEFPLLLHCYTSGLELMKKCLDLGAYVSISGIATFKNATDVRDNIKYIPLDRLMAETDCPYLAPVPKRGQKNEPLYVNHVAEFLANYLEQDLDSLKSTLDANFLRLFNKANYVEN